MNEKDFEQWRDNVDDNDYTQAITQYISGEEEDECLRKYYKEHVEEVKQ